jgi:hypothetical protein
VQGDYYSQDNDDSDDVKFERTSFKDLHKVVLTINLTITYFDVYYKYDCWPHLFEAPRFPLLRKDSGFRFYIEYFGHFFLNQ